MKIMFDGTNAAEVISGNIGTDELLGHGGNDAINGLGGDDTLKGMRGDDTLNGGAGDDRMNGGLGDDSFVFAAGFGHDRIIGFDAKPAEGQDMLDISAFGDNGGHLSMMKSTSPMLGPTPWSRSWIAGTPSGWSGSDNSTTVTVDDFILDGATV